MNGKFISSWSFRKLGTSRNSFEGSFDLRPHLPPSKDSNSCKDLPVDSLKRSEVSHEEKQIRCVFMIIEG